MDPVKNLMEPAKNSVFSMSTDLISEFHAAVEREDKSIVEAILKMGINIETRNKNGSTALITAVKHKNIPIIKLLLNYGADIEATIRCSFTPLLIAIRHNEFGLVKLLVSSGADVNKKGYNCKKSKTLIPLHQALRHPDGRIFKYLLDTRKVDYQDLLSASKHVIRCSYPEKMAEILLQSFLSDDYSYPKSDGMVLNLAIMAKNDRVIESFIIHNNSNVTLMKWRGQYPIHRAVKSNNVNCVIRLLSIGANIDIMNNSGRTPLYYAAKKQNTVLTFFLLRRGANTLALNNPNGHRWLEERILLKNTEFIEEILDKCPDILHFYTPRPDEYFAALVKKYIIKLTIAEMPVDQYFLDWEEFSSQNTTEETYISRYCNTEISLLKQEKICKNSYLTYYHFLTYDIHRLANYIRNTDVTSNFNQNQLEKKFPIYGRIILNSFNRATHRLMLILNFETVLADILCNFPVNFVRRIPDYLSDKDLRMLL